MQGYSTQLVAESSGGDEAEEVNAHTGCIGCNLASKDVAPDALLKLPQWAYLAPLKRLKPLYTEMKRPLYRLRKQGERNKDGRLSANPMRLGPYTMEARCAGLWQVLTIQDEVNQAAHTRNRPHIDLINAEEQARILELIAADTWPDRWTGHEVRGDALIPLVLAEGITQPLLGGSHDTDRP
jgi:DNA sulfur modification protein DndC